MAAGTSPGTARRADLAVATGICVLLAVLPLVSDSRYLLGQVIVALFYAIVAVQWNLLFGYAGIFSLAQMALFALGGYAAAMLAHYAEWSMWTAIGAGTALTAAFGTVVGLACLRLKGVYLALFTLAIAEALHQIIVTDTSCFRRLGPLCQQFTGGNAGFTGFGDLGTRALAGSHWLTANYVIVAVLFVITTALTRVLVASPGGRALRALRDNPAAAVACGVDRFRTTLAVFAFSSLLTGLAGAVYAGHLRAIGPNLFALPQLLLVIAAVVIGGLGTFWGPLLGIAVVMAADELMREFGAYRALGLGLMITLTMVLRPAGLLGGTARH